MSYCCVDGFEYEWKYAFEWFWCQIAIAALLMLLAQEAGDDWTRALIEDDE